MEARDPKVDDARDGFWVKYKSRNKTWADGGFWFLLLLRQKGCWPLRRNGFCLGKGHQGTCFEARLRRVSALVWAVGVVFLRLDEMSALHGGPRETEASLCV